MQAVPGLASELTVSNTTHAGHSPGVDAASPVLAADAALRPDATAYYQRNRELVWTFLVFILLQSAAILALIVNMTHRYRSEHALAESEWRIRTIVRALPDLVCTVDQEGICVEAYAAPSTAPPEKLRAMQGVALTAALQVENSDEVNTALSKTLELNRAQVFECRTRGPEPLWYSGRSTPLDVPESQPYRVLVALRDVTADKHVVAEQLGLERREQHDQKLESLGMMAGGIAHDFNNLLMGISGNAELGLQETGLDAHVRSYFDSILNAANCAAHLSLQMLAYSGRHHTCHTEIDLSQLVKGARDTFDNVTSSKARVAIDCGHGVTMVRGNAERLQQAIINVVTNAGEAIGDAAGTITVSVVTSTLTTAELTSRYLSEPPAAGDYVVLKVQDDGSGIDPDNIGRIFDPFFSTKFTGRGLGLASVLGIVRSHHGTVSAESSPFDGTTISLFLPCAHHPGNRVAQVSPLPLTQPPTHGSKTILLADDEEAVRIVGTRMLRKNGYVTVTVNDGQAAVDSLTADPHRYCAAIVDVTMPRKDGLVAYREMHAVAPQLPIIMASGYSRGQIQDKLTEDEKIPFLHKPFRMTELVRVLQESVSDPS